MFSVLYGVWAVNHVTFDGDVCRDLSAHFLSLAEKQGATVPLMIGHRLMGISLLSAGEAAKGRGHLNRAIALYDPAEHRSVVTRFGVDTGVSVLCFRSFAQWMLGYPEAALADTNQALEEARRIGQAATLMYALGHAPLTRFQCGNHATANAEANELVALAEEKDALFWKEWGMLVQGCGLALSGNAADAVHMITFGITALRSTGATLWLPLQLLYLTRAYVELAQFGDASRCIGEAITAAQTTKERWYEADIHRIAGEIALRAPGRNPIKAQSCFERALAVAREQQAKSWELRAATSLARLWRDQGKVQQARELLAPVYGWFTEGFDTRDLKDAKALLEELHS